MAEAEVLNNVRRRRRVVKSCEQCRKRKLRCDRELPCRPCKASRQALKCTYDASVSRTSTSPTAQVIGARGARPQPDHVTASVEQDPVVHSLSLATGKAWPSTTSSPHPTPHPHLRTETDKTRMFGQSHWMHAFDQAQLLASIQTHSAYATSLQGEIITLVKDASKTRIKIKNKRSANVVDPVPDLLNTLPTKDLCDQLVENYLRLFEPMFRILHVPSFRTDYQQFWENQQLGTKPFLLKLLMILTIGSIFHPDRAESDSVRTPAHAWVQAVQWWLTGPTEKAAMCMDGVQVFCLMVLARHSNSLGGSTPISTDSLLKLAFSIGLHVDPATFPSLGPFQREMRRRLWATVLEIMVMSSLDSSLPLLISMDDFTSSMASNINDTDIAPKMDTLPELRTETEFTDMSVSLVLQKSLQCRLLVVRKLNNIHPPISYDDTVKLGNELSQHCRDVSRSFQSVFSSDSRASNFHRKFVDSYIRRFLLLISRLYLLQAHRDPRYLFARKTCLECCQIISSHVYSLQLPSPVTDEFLLLAMRGSGLFKGPLGQDIIISLSLEISTQLEEECDSPENPLNKSDPLIQLSRAARRPLVDTLRHIHGQLRHIIALGRPSCKRYIKLSAILAHIDAVESGVEDPRPKIMDAMIESIRVCMELMIQTLDRETTSGVGTPWTEDTNNGWADSWGLLGFDTDFIDPTLALNLPVMMGTNYANDGANGLP
ncbi:hypothetical protein BKA67DRAFT_145476 [Truncatella angustata]|uniref:Zn(2)-C6 fungal-type domain-containing protein n=1 Tax=Truncatella angustata TaxID=152316 RepID=A0A9P8UB42_9PEZI|nr:uncharacterized protein BKA67DRAFT_145476 [Truncatella angustata]KAH6638632.1 hypothetical protein BKA67DRAFT_145476 [Truncatella angustata]